MKKRWIIVFVFIVLVCTAIFASSNRESLYIRFGPKLLEAIVMVIKDEINLLRTEHGLAERTNQQLITAIDTKLADMNDYDWMARQN